MEENQRSSLNSDSRDSDKNLMSVISPPPFSSEEYLPIALISAANAYSKCRDYESHSQRILYSKKNENQRKSLSPLLNRKGNITNDTARNSPFRRIDVDSHQHISNPISIADFLYCAPSDVKNPIMSLVDSEDDEEADEDTNSKKWENLKNSISEHNNLLSNSSQCIDGFSFPIPLSRGASLVPPYAILYPSETDTSETDL